MARLPDGSLRYRPRTEGLRRDHPPPRRPDDYWRVRNKDGFVSTYGKPGTADADPAVLADRDARRRVFAWRLTRSEIRSATRSNTSTSAISSSQSRTARITSTCSTCGASLRRPHHAGRGSLAGVGHVLLRRPPPTPSPSTARGSRSAMRSPASARHRAHRPGAAPRGGPGAPVWHGGAAGAQLAGRPAGRRA